jgi:type IV pilus assembly protein PilO
MAPPARSTGRPGTTGTSAGQTSLTTQLLAVVMFIGVALAVYYNMFYLPLSDAMQSETRRSQTVQQQYETAQRDLRQYNADVAELERSRNRAREIQRILPDTADMPGFLRNINTLAEASGLTITRIEPLEEKVEAYFVRVPVRLEVTGSYLAMARFFRAVSQLPRVINMENITLADATREGDDVKLKAKVLATTFRSPAPGETPPPPPNAARGNAPARPAATGSRSGGGR